MRERERVRERQQGGEREKQQERDSKRDTARERAREREQERDRDSKRERERERDSKRERERQDRDIDYLMLAYSYTCFFLIVSIHLNPNSKRVLSWPATSRILAALVAMREGKLIRFSRVVSSS